MDNSTSSSGSTGSFPLTSIAILETADQYPKWIENVTDYLILNNLMPDVPTAAINMKACTVVRNRLGYTGRQDIKALTQLDAILALIAKNFKPKGSGVYTELVQQLHSITLSSGAVKDVSDYTKQFQQTDVAIADLHDTLKLPQAYIIQLYLMNLGESYSVFQTTFTQSHSFYGDDACTFREVALATANEEKRMAVYQSDPQIAMAAGRVTKSTKPPREKSRENCEFCKKAGRKHKHPSAKCWTQHPHLKPDKFKTDAEKAAAKSSNPAKPQEPKEDDEDAVHLNLAYTPYEYAMRGAAHRP